MELRRASGLEQSQTCFERCVKSPCKTTLVVLGIILMIGGALAAGLLYSYLGYVSLSCLVAVPIGVILNVIGACRRDALLPNPHKNWNTARVEETSTSFEPITKTKIEPTTSIVPITNEKTKKDSTSPLIIIIDRPGLKLDLFNKYDTYNPQAEDDIPKKLSEKSPRFEEKIKNNESVVLFYFVNSFDRIGDTDWGFMGKIIIAFQDNPNVKLHIVRLCGPSSDSLSFPMWFDNSDVGKASNKNPYKSTVMIYNGKTICQTSKETDYAVGKPIDESLLKKMAEECFNVKRMMSVKSEKSLVNIDPINKAKTKIAPATRIAPITNEKTKKDSASPLIIVIDIEGLKLDFFKNYDTYDARIMGNVRKELSKIANFEEKIKNNEKVVIFYFLNTACGRIGETDWMIIGEILIEFQDNPNVKLHAVLLNVSDREQCNAAKLFISWVQNPKVTIANNKNPCKSTIMIWSGKTVCQTSKEMDYAAGKPIDESMLKKMAEETFPS